MKTINKASIFAAALGVAMFAGSCDDYLDITPPSQISPEVYLFTADQLGSYTIKYYKSNDDVDGSRGSNAFPSFGSGASVWSGTEIYMGDEGTDNESGTNDRFFNGPRVKVGASGGDWSWGTINDLNYYIRTVLPRYEAGEITGTDEAIRHYIGEGYMLRAIEYFKKLRSLGDFPIVTSTLPLDRNVLIEQSKRRPRNVVARFILADLDSALRYLSDGAQTGGRNRITRDGALIEKARVALYEATFEKYFAGTPFVPDRGAGWPGASMAYNSGFTYDNAQEVEFFLKEALAAAKEVADRHPQLTQNNKALPGRTADKATRNPYYDLFASQDLSSYDEAIMYRSYANNKAGHCFSNHMNKGHGYTQEFANSFLMTNGLPIYASGSNYAGDDWIDNTRTDRDWRWQLFMKAPGDYIYEGNADRRIGVKTGDYKVPMVYGEGNFATSTGYQKSKGWNTNSGFASVGSDLTAAVIYRVAEAYLIYMEAAWEKYGDNLDANAWTYWQRLRERAGLPSDPRVTIAATDLAKEEQTSHDLGLWSAGVKISSPVLYNIRRERRCELISEGMRYDDLIRWRALDQLIDKPVYPHGCKVFGPMEASFPKNKLKYDKAKDKDNNVSSPTDTEGGFNGDPSYLSLLRISKSNEWYNSGFSWRMAHYLNPIAESHFLESSASGDDIETSPLYQNPYWSTSHDTPAIK